MPKQRQRLENTINVDDHQRNTALHAANHLRMVYNMPLSLFDVQQIATKP